MRIKLESPVAGPIEPSTYISVDNARIVRGNVICTVAFWADSGRKNDQCDKELSPEDYAAWCDTDINSDDETFFAEAHLKSRGLKAAPLPPPPPPPKPETDEERKAREESEAIAAAAQKEQNIVDLKLSIEEMTAQLAALTG